MPAPNIAVKFYFLGSYHPGNCEGSWGPPKYCKAILYKPTNKSILLLLKYYSNSTSNGKTNWTGTGEPTIFKLCRLDDWVAKALYTEHASVFLFSTLAASPLKSLQPPPLYFSWLLQSGNHMGLPKNFIHVCQSKMQQYDNIIISSPLRQGPKKTIAQRLIK